MIHNNVKNNINCYHSDAQQLGIKQSLKHYYSSTYVANYNKAVQEETKYGSNVVCLKLIPTYA